MRWALDFGRFITPQCPGAPVAVPARRRQEPGVEAPGVEALELFVQKATRVVWQIFKYFKARFFNSYCYYKQASIRGEIRVNYERAIRFWNPNFGKFLTGPSEAIPPNVSCN